MCIRDRLEADCRFARQLGYVGKTLIHPAQVAVANAVFAPSAAEVEWAQRLTAAFAEHQRSGAGAFAWEGKMVDMQQLIVRNADNYSQRMNEVIGKNKRNLPPINGPPDAKPRQAGGKNDWEQGAPLP